VIDCPELIFNREELLALRQTWFVAIIPTGYTSHVLLPRLKIFSLVSEILNLKLDWINVAWPGRESPCSCE
jgi:hypothetical protein